MNPKEYLDIIHLAEKLKDATRHCYTSGGRKESVAEHCWRICLMAYFMKDEFPDVDIDKVIKMCIVHDLGEIFTGDIPVFDKTAADEHHEFAKLSEWVTSMPDEYAKEMAELYSEINSLDTTEAKLFKAIDGLEAVIQHNESDISTWLPNEYNLNLTYAYDKVEFSPYLKELREAIKQETIAKIENEDKNQKSS